MKNIRCEYDHEHDLAQSNTFFLIILFSILFRESIRRNLIRNLENLRSVHLTLNSSVTNDRYYEDSTDSLDNSCESHQLTISPLRAKNINGEWKVVANIGDLFEQRITVTNCRYISRYKLLKARIKSSVLYLFVS